MTLQILILFFLFSQNKIKNKLMNRIIFDCKTKFTKETLSNIYVQDELNNFSYDSISDLLKYVCIS